jgi:hypothetical protein
MDVKVTDPPGHTGLADGVMLIEAGTVDFTFIKMGFEVTGPVAQERLEFNMQVTKSPFPGL